MAVTLPPNRLQRAEHSFVEYCVPLPDDVSMEQAMKPEYWAHVGRQLKRWDMIVLLSEVENTRTTAIVAQAGAGFAILKPLETISLDRDSDTPVASPADLYVKYHGPHDRYIVARRSDGEKLKIGFVEKSDAERWLADHVAALNR